MTDPDDNVRERYRRLGNEEPPPALDAAILASARRAVSRPTMRWSGPVSIAAVLVLAVGVTLRMRQEEPGIETSMPSEYATPAPAPQFEESRRALDATREPDTASKTDDAKAKAAPAPKPVPAPMGVPGQKVQAQPRDHAEAERKDAAPERQQAKKDEAQAFADKPAKLPAAPAEAPAPAAPSVAAVEKNRMEALPASPPPAARADSVERSASGLAAPSAASAPTSAASAEARAKRAAPMAQPQLAKEASNDPLVRELERIAALRREGRHAEADKALEEFRRLNPDYRIPDAVWEQVKPR